MRRTGVVLLLIMVVATGCATTSSLEDSARRGLYLDAHPALPAALRSAVLNGHVMAGMSREMVLAALGRPERTEPVMSPSTVYDCWVYGDTRYETVITYLYFRGEMLVGFDQKEAPVLAIAQARLGGVDRRHSDVGRHEPSSIGMK